MGAPTASAQDRPEPRGGVVGAGVLSALIYAVSLLAPALAVVSLLAPFPLSVARLRRGAPAALIAAGLAAALIAAAFSPLQAFMYLLVLAATGLLLGEALARGRGLLRGCKWAFLWLGAQIGAALLFAGPQLAERVLQPLEEYRSPAFLQSLRASGVPAERVEEWAEQFGTLHRALEVVYPAAYLIMGALIVLANAALLRAWLARRDPGWLDGGEFETLRFPHALALAFVVSGGAVALPPLRDVGYNALLLVAFFFALQGMAVVAYYARRLAGPPFLRALLVLLVLVNPWAPQILALVGLFDTWFDFRKWAQPPAESGRQG
jgi:uncharacterized protein YybS (DUF2232 family)